MHIQIVNLSHVQPWNINGMPWWPITAHNSLCKIIVPNICANLLLLSRTDTLKCTIGTTVKKRTRAISRNKRPIEMNIKVASANGVLVQAHDRYLSALYIIIQNDMMHNMLITHIYAKGKIYTIELPINVLFYYCASIWLMQ